MNYILIAILICLLTGIFQFFIKNENKKFNFTIFFNSISSVLFLIPTVQVLKTGQAKEIIFKMGDLIGLTPFVLDSLSSFFVLIISVISFLTLIYGKKYLTPYENKTGSHLFLFNLFVVSMILVVLCQSAVSFLICWELMSLSSFLLMLYDGQKTETRKTSIQYLVMMHFGVLFLILGFVLMNLKTGSLLFADFSGQICDLVFILFFIGFGIKAGFAPLHTWLPSAHPVAPTHISALMSGVMIKTGIYGILRILSLDYQVSIFVSYLVLLVGLASAFFGILYAICQKDFKKMLAYSSVENMGIIGIALGVSLLGVAYKNDLMASFGFLGCFLHILNHSVFKPLMFFGAGCVYKMAHTKNMEKLGGLIKKMPITAICFLIGSSAISAIPPFNGFVSEFLIYLGFLNSFSTNNYFVIPVIILSMAILAFVGAMALIAFTNAFSIIFLGTSRDEASKSVSSDVSKYMLIPMIILVVFASIIGLFPQFAINVIEAPVSMFFGFSPNYYLLTIISYLNITFLILFLVFFGIRCYLLKNKTASSETWGCGYDKGTSKIQYTANSFTRPFLGFLTPFYVRVLEFKQIKELFPTKTTFKSRIFDIFDSYLIRPIVKMDEFIIKKFYWIQSGDTQRYLWYGLLALIVSLILVLGGKI